MKAMLQRLFGARAAVPEERKASRAGALIALHAIGRPRWTPRDYAALAREGYERNAIVHRCVRMTAEAAAAIPWRLMEGRDEVLDHPLAALIARPNAREAGQAFFETLYGHLLVSGNAYVEAVSVDGAMREWHALRPDRIEITPGADGWPEAYDYVVGAQRIRFAMNGDGAAPILHLKLFNPLDDHYGFSPIAAAQVALDLHNAAGQWNKALLDNAARPSGALVYQGAQGHLSEEQFARLKAELEENFEGPRNAGRPLLLEGGLDWKSLSLTPKDMDFVEARASAAREIALAFGIPPMILGLPGDNTYSNYREANLAFWRQTIIPLVQRTQKSFEAWLAPLWPDMRIDYDLDRLDALAEERAREWARIDAASFLTEDEKREALGFGARPQTYK